MVICEDTGETVYRYKDYIRTKHWLKFYKKITSLEEFKKCSICEDDTSYIQLHHKTYKNIGKETKNDVIAVCRLCHIDIHMINGKIKNTENVTRGINDLIIDDLRKQHSMTWAELSRLSGISKGKLSEIKNGQIKRLNYSYELKLANAFGIEKKYLYAK